MEIIGLKLKQNFMDIICKVEKSKVEGIMNRDINLFEASCPMFLQFTPVHNDSGQVAGHQPNLQPVNTLTDDPKKDVIWFSMEDIFVTMEISSKAKNMYREVLGDITVASNDIVMP